MRLKNMLIVTLMTLIVSCNNNSLSHNTSNNNSSSSNNIVLSIDDLPKKSNANDSAAHTSPINSRNLDQYMFLDFVQYVDVRKIEQIVNDGYIAGFEFIPFYSLICSLNEGTRLFMMERIVTDGGIISAGQIGSFSQVYEESLLYLESLFSKDKVIFLVSTGGSECAYMMNLLIQFGYDGNKIYNVGGVVNSEGVPPYKSIKENKYYVNGTYGFDVNVKFDFLEDLTPIK